MTDYRIQPNYKFTDIYENATVFYSGDDENDIIGWTTSPYYSSDLLTQADVNFIYYLLYANYGNSHILSSDVNRFQFQLMCTVYQYAPLWKKQTEIQKKLREMSEDELREGAKAIHNRAAHDSSAPSTDTTEELTYIDGQDVSKYKKSKVESYGILLELLKTDVTQEFMNHFKKLFQNVISLQEPILYESEDA